MLGRNPSAGKQQLSHWSNAGMKQTSQSKAFDGFPSSSWLNLSVTVSDPNPQTLNLGLALKQHHQLCLQLKFTNLHADMPFSGVSNASANGARHFLQRAVIGTYTHHSISSVHYWCACTTCVHAHTFPYSILDHLFKYFSFFIMLNL